MWVVFHLKRISIVTTLCLLVNAVTIAAEPTKNDFKNCFRYASADPIEQLLKYDIKEIISLKEDPNAPDTFKSSYLVKARIEIIRNGRYAGHSVNYGDGADNRWENIVRSQPPGTIVERNIYTCTGWLVENTWNAIEKTSVETSEVTLPPMNELHARSMVQSWAQEVENKITNPDYYKPKIISKIYTVVGEMTHFEKSGFKYIIHADINVNRSKHRLTDNEIKELPENDLKKTARLSAKTPLYTYHYEYVVYKGLHNAWLVNDYEKVGTTQHLTFDK